MYDQVSKQFIKYSTTKQNTPQVARSGYGLSHTAHPVHHGFHLHIAGRDWYNTASRLRWFGAISLAFPLPYHWYHAGLQPGYRLPRTHALVIVAIIDTITLDSLAP